MSFDLDRSRLRAAHGNPESYKQIRSMMDLFHHEMARDWDESEKELACSTGNSKTTGSRPEAVMWSYSTMPGFSCMVNGAKPPCFTSGAAYCLHDMIYRGAMSKAVHNTVLILRFPEAFARSYRGLSEAGLIRRIHVEGDFVNMTELRIVDENTRCECMCYTKKYAMVNAYLKRKRAANLSFQLLFSKWDGLKMDNPYNFPVFSVSNTGRDFLHTTAQYRCGDLRQDDDGEWHPVKGNCSHCLRVHGGCFAVKKGEEVNVLAH